VSTLSFDLPPGQLFGPLAILSEWAVSVHAFRRNKVSVPKKVLAAALCNSGYSYREVAKMMGGMSYVAARDAYVSLMTSLPQEERSYRRAVAIDGADVQVDGEYYQIWLARDVDTGVIMCFQASPGASAEDGARFLANVASQCANRPLLRLGTGPSAPRGLTNLDLYFQTPANQNSSIFMRLGRLLRGSAS
jgi:transposase-like protein